MSEEKSLCARWKDALDELRGALDVWERRLEKAGALSRPEARRGWEVFLADTASLQSRFDDLRARDAVLARELGAALADAVKLRGSWLRLAQGYSKFGVDPAVSVALEVMGQLQARRRLGEAVDAHGADLASELADRLSDALKLPEQELESARRTRAKAERLLEERRRSTESLERDFQARHEALQSKLAALEAEKAHLLSRLQAEVAEERLRSAEAKAQAEREHAAAALRLHEHAARLDERRRQAEEREEEAVERRLEAYRKLETLSAELERRARAGDEEKAAAEAARAETARLAGELERAHVELERVQAELAQAAADLDAERRQVQRLTAELQSAFQSEPGA